MMQAWRIVREVGADAEAMHEAGGIQAFVARAVGAGEMVDAVDDAVERAAETLEAGDDETVFKSVSSLPSPAPVDVPASDSEDRGGPDNGRSTDRPEARETHPCGGEGHRSPALG